MEPCVSCFLSHLLYGICVKIFIMNRYISKSYTTTKSARLWPSGDSCSVNFPSQLLLVLYCSLVCFLPCIFVVLYSPHLYSLVTWSFVFTVATVTLIRCNRNKRLVGTVKLFILISQATNYSLILVRNFSDNL